MSWLFGLVTGGWGWLLAIGKWCLANWRLVVCVLAAVALVSFIFLKGIKYERSSWEKKWAARDAQEAFIENEHQRQIAELDGAIDFIEAQAAAAKAAREKEYEGIEKDLADYVTRLKNRPAGTCPTGITDDGVRLINRAAGVPGADQGHR